MHCRTLAVVLLLFAVSLIVHQLAMPPLRYPFCCVPRCSRDFRSQRGLSIHQAVCPVYNQHQHQEMVALAQASADAELYDSVPMPFIAPPSPARVSEQQY